MDKPPEPILVPPAMPPRAPDEAFTRFRVELEGGTHWYIAALHAISVWSVESEVFQGRRIHYLIDGEALDVLRVLERLIAECPDRVDRADQRQLLFSGEPPIRLPEIAFAAALGPINYKAYLNYFYGVTVEEALLHVAELALGKAHALDGARAHDAYTHVYHSELCELLDAFGVKRGRRVGRNLRWAESKEFTYWLFRYRLRTQVPARMASDTKKALDHLRQIRGFGPDTSPDPLRPDARDEALSPTATHRPTVIDIATDIGFRS